MLSGFGTRTRTKDVKACSFMVLILFLIFSQAATCFVLNLNYLDFYFVVNLCMFLSGIFAVALWCSCICNALYFFLFVHRSCSHSCLYWALLRYIMEICSCRFWSYSWCHPYQILGHGYFQAAWWRQGEAVVWVAERGCFEFFFLLHVKANLRLACVSRLDK